MAWWDDLWLNEGFASWMETKASDHFHPDWLPLLDRVDGRERAMGLDAFATTHPIVQTIRTVEDTNQAFDAITYQKGRSEEHTSEPQSLMRTPYHDFCSKKQT